jgi:hypothetical protein
MSNFLRIVGLTVALAAAPVALSTGAYAFSWGCSQ